MRIELALRDRALIGLVATSFTNSRLHCRPPNWTGARGIHWSFQLLPKASESCLARFNPRWAFVVATRKFNGGLRRWFEHKRRQLTTAHPPAIPDGRRSGCGLRPFSRQRSGRRWADSIFSQKPLAHRL